MLSIGQNVAEGTLSLTLMRKECFPVYNMSLLHYFVSLSYNIIYFTIWSHKDNLEYKSIKNPAEGTFWVTYEVTMFVVLKMTFFGFDVYVMNGNQVRSN